MYFFLFLSKISAPFRHDGYPLVMLQDYYHYLFSQINIYVILSVFLNLLLLSIIVYGIIILILSLIDRHNNVPNRHATLFPGSPWTSGAFGLNISKKTGIFIIVLIALWALLFLGISKYMHFDSKEKNIVGILLLNLFLQCSVIITIAENIPFSEMNRQKSTRFFKRYQFLYTAMIITFIGAFIVNMGMMRLLRIPPSYQPIINLLIKVENPVILTIICIQALVIAPLAEEFFFRGFLFRLMRIRLHYIPAALFSSIVFSVLHKSLYTVFPLICLGMVFAYAYERTRNILYPVTLHAGYNLLILLYVLAFKNLAHS